MLSKFIRNAGRTPGTGVVVVEIVGSKRSVV